MGELHDLTTLTHTGWQGLDGKQNWAQVWPRCTDTQGSPNCDLPALGILRWDGSACWG